MDSLNNIFLKNEKKTIIVVWLIAISSFLVGSIIFDKAVLVLVFLFCLLKGSMEKSFINPYYLFSLTPLSLLAYFNISRFYMLDLTHQTYVLANLNIIAFTTSLSVTSEFKRIYNCQGLGSGSKLKLNAMVLFSLALVGSFIDSLHAVLWIFAIPAIVCALKSKSKLMYLLTAIYIVIATREGASKMSMVCYCIVFMISIERFYLKPLYAKKYMRWLATGSLVLVIFAFSFANKERGHYNSDKGLEDYSANEVNWKASSSLFLPYMYFTTPWANLQYVTETQTDKTYGLWMAKPILGYIGLDGNYEEDYKLYSLSTFNTFTFISVEYKDFGLFFSIIVSFFLGFYVKKIYTRFLISNSPLDIGCYCLVALATAEMFFSNHFFMQSYPFTVLIGTELYKFLLCRGNNIEINHVYN